jgi:hypothetical protein
MIDSHFMIGKRKMITQIGSGMGDVAAAPLVSALSAVGDAGQGPRGTHSRRVDWRRLATICRIGVGLLLPDIM